MDALAPREGASACVPDQLIGRKHLKLLQRHLRRLNRCTAHPNRVLQYADLLTLLLMGFFNPVCRSLRSLKNFTKSPNLREHLPLRRPAPPTLQMPTAPWTAACWSH